MAQSVIGALRVTLGADTAAFDKGLKRANKGMAAFGKGMAKTGLAIGVALAGTVTALGVAVVRTIGNIDDLGKTAQKIGIPIEELSKLKHAAELSGVSIGTLSTGIQRLSRNMFDMAALGTGEGADAFRAVGVAVTDADGKMRSASQVMAAVSEKFAGMEDGAGKTALAMKLFGKSGAEMIPLLNVGAAGLNEMMREAESLGIVLDGKTFKAAELFNDSMARIGKSWDGIVTQITIALAPALADVAAKFSDMAVNSDVAKRVGASLASTLMGLPELFVKIAYRAEIMGHSLTSALDVVSRINMFGMTGAITAFQEAREESGRLWREMDSTLVRMKLQSEFMAAGFRPALVGTSTALRDLTTGVAANSKALTEQKKVMEEGKRVIAEMRTPAEALTLEFERLGNLLQARAIDWETYARAVEKAQDQFDDFKDSSNAAMGQIKETVGSVTSNMESAFSDFTESGKVKFKDLTRSILSDLAKVAFRQALTPVGDSLSSGLGSLFSSAPGFATGGSIMPGGSGGIDSQLMVFRKSPQEQVDIYTPGKDGGAVGGDSISLTVHLDARGDDGSAANRAVAEIKAELPRLVVGAYKDARKRKRI